MTSRSQVDVFLAASRVEAVNPWLELTMADGGQGGFGVRIERSCPAPPSPAGLSETLQGYSRARHLIGESRGVVHRLHGKPEAPGLYLKSGQDSEES